MELDSNQINEKYDKGDGSGGHHGDGHGGRHGVGQAVGGSYAGSHSRIKTGWDLDFQGRKIPKVSISGIFDSFFIRTIFNILQHSSVFDPLPSSLLFLHESFLT